MNFIVAVSSDYAIGKNNDLLFHLPSDLKYFKEKTLNNVVIMGERTYH
ncbi:MAG: dihydrofolate reductase [Clostridia bacterium]|nr:dihydrofolate reductase [Clostridia bacterium]